MPHVIEPASSGRATCRGCGTRIAAGALRFGERLPNPFADEAAEMTLWFHLRCGAFRRPEPFLEALAAATEAVPDRAALEHDAASGVPHRRLPRVSTASRAPTGRAICRQCRSPIPRGRWRIALVFHEDGRFVPSGYVHAACAAAYTGSGDVMPRVAHFSPALTVADLAAVKADVEGAGAQA